MTLWLIILPLLALVLVALIQHARITRYWPACGWSGILSAGIMFPWLIAMKLWLGDADSFGLIDVGWYMLLAGAYGISGAVIAVFVGIPYYFERRLQSRKKDSSS